MSEKDMTVTRLAEAMSSEFPDAYGNAYRHWSEVALRAIAADPSLAGFKTVTVSELFATTPNDPDLPRDTANMWAPILIVPDPDPPAPELPSVEDAIRQAFFTAIREIGFTPETVPDSNHLTGFQVAHIGRAILAAAEAGRSQT